MFLSNRRHPPKMTKCVALSVRKNIKNVRLGPKFNVESIGSIKSTVRIDLGGEKLHFRSILHLKRKYLITNISSDIQMVTRTIIDQFLTQNSILRSIPWSQVVFCGYQVATYCHLNSTFSVLVPYNLNVKIREPRYSKSSRF